MKKVFVTGANGMLGTELMRLLGRDRNVEAIPSTLDTLDITDLAAVRTTLARVRPSHLVHCAAFTHVDTAEKDPLQAFAVNAEGTKNLAFFCRELEIEMIYVSTDYVFPGTKRTPYEVSDPPGPINVYGASKLLGETYVEALLDRYKIVRTSWLNGLAGDYTRNFIETMLRVSETRSVLHLVNDQHGRPTFTFDLAPAIITLLDVNQQGIYHVSNSGECSWYEFARAIFEEAANTRVSVRPILSEQFRSAARRPTYSVMSTARYEGLGLKPLPTWRDSLREYFRRRRVLKEASAPRPALAGA